MTQSGHCKHPRGQQFRRPSHLSSDPLVSGRVSVATKATAAPTETYQKNQLLWAMLLSHWMTSGAVPPKRATVRLYQAPMPRPRSRVGNSSLMIAGAIELFIAYRPSPQQNTRSPYQKPPSGWISAETGTISSAIAPDHTSS